VDPVAVHLAGDEDDDRWDVGLQTAAETEPERRAEAVAAEVFAVERPDGEQVQEGRGLVALRPPAHACQLLLQAVEVERPLLRQSIEQPRRPPYELRAALVAPREHALLFRDSIRHLRRELRAALVPPREHA
jgi:hypothetical protein